MIAAADHAGWAHLVCVAALGLLPRVIDRRRVTTIAAGLSTMPYHHESLALSIEDANTLIARAAVSFRVHVASAAQIIADLAPAYRVIALAIREPAFPKLPDSVIVPATVRR